MIVNLANAIRLQGREGEAKKLLETEDWSAASDDFRICIAAVKGEVKEVVDLMRRLGSDGPIQAEAYRLWPVFRGLQNDESFNEAFQTLFGEPLKRPESIEIASGFEDVGAETTLEPVPETRH